MSFASQVDMAYSAIGRLLRCQTSRTVRQSMNFFAQKRNWSTAAVPTWNPTSSSELDTSLSRFRNLLFIPHALSIEQRRLIYKPQNAQKLKENPITVYVGPDEEPYELRSIDKHSLPSKQDAMKVIDLMKETGNWSNFVPFLIGLRESGFVFKAHHLESIIAEAGSTNGLGYFSEAVKQSAKTGVTIGHVDVAQRLFFELHVQAQKNEFQGPKFEKTYRLASQFARLLEAPEIATQESKADPKRKPSIIGVLLELSAANAVNNGKVDANGEVRAYARRFLASWKTGSNKAPEKWDSVDRQLREIVPIYNGMKLALEVSEVANDRTIAPAFKEQIEVLGEVIAESKISVSKEAHENPTAGLLQARALHN
ncbi:hypothetical protein BJX65DRAFT_282033 [Aspergillus insuetus]